MKFRSNVALIAVAKVYKISLSSSFGFGVINVLALAHSRVVKVVSHT